MSFERINLLYSRHWESSRKQQKLKM